MTLREIIEWLGRKEPEVYAALCTARSDGSLARYPAGEEHAILAMVRAEEMDVDQAIIALLEGEGWRSVVIEERRKLEVPFLSKDREVSACYINAVTSDGGIIVYTDPVYGQGTAVEQMVGGGR